MQQKVDSAAWAWRAGTAVVICNGMRPNVIRDVLDGKKVCLALMKVWTETSEESNKHRLALLLNFARFLFNLLQIGTFFTSQDSISEDVQRMADAVRKGGRQLASLQPAERRAIVEKLASLLLERQEELLAANKRDLKDAEATKLSKPLLSRLSLTPAKLEDLASGLRQIASSSESLLGHVLKRTQV